MVVHSRSASVVLVALATVMVAGCGAAIDGTYKGGDDSFLQSITFKSGGRVHITFMGMTSEGTYKVEGDDVTISVNGDTQVLRNDGQGCLIGGGFLGSYCKDERKPT